MLSKISKLLAEFEAELKAVRNKNDFERVRVKFTGKKSELKNLFQDLAALLPEEKKSSAKILNDAKTHIEESLEALSKRLDSLQIEEKLQKEWIDTTLPGYLIRRGSRHPITYVENKIVELFRPWGFVVEEGPEIETNFYNFDALNIPEHHPARDMQDTFVLEGNKLLRSHTTTVQVRALERRPKLPIKVVSAGKVYRNEAIDTTHLATFHQFEALWVDEGIKFSHLKGLIREVILGLYGKDTVMRFKPKYYPYTEPSVGTDIQCSNCKGNGCPACHFVGWITVLGSGMVHPIVLQQFGFDPEKISGLAIGMGLSRLVSQFFKISNLKSLYYKDLRVLKALSK